MSRHDQQTVDAAIRAANLMEMDRVTLPARSARLVKPPNAIPTGVATALSLKFPKGIFSHQALAIDAVLRGDDICLSTATASGKSLAFMSAAASIVHQQPQARVLALYPMKALIQDQHKKWESFLRPLGIHSVIIDGSISRQVRLPALREAHVVLMTPDVAHAWLLGNVGDLEVRTFLAAIRLLILDEAHVYDGVFGTNMAFFLRRLEAASGARYRVITSTATIGDTADFTAKLTGRSAFVIGPELDGSSSSSKEVVLVEPTIESEAQPSVPLLRELALGYPGRFIAFVDSRIQVERLVSAVHRRHLGEESQNNSILPYRAGYEEIDRTKIQQALAEGTLAGVVSTSALELGLDIGDIDLVLLIGVPSGMKAFWQRAGRAGRQRSGWCVLLDPEGVIRENHGGLRSWLDHPTEPSWLYLENRYIQYSNALSAAQEQRDLGKDPKLDAFRTLPETFIRMVENELDPQENVPDDLYELKQRAQSGPHVEFPIRSGIEPNFQVVARDGRKLGQLTKSQAMREAYPGAIYYYMATPYRIEFWRTKEQEICARPDGSQVTRPLRQAKVFPRFVGGTYSVRLGALGFVAEAELQVSERVMGFQQKRGNGWATTKYEPGSPFSQREINNFFRTTGVCWFFDDPFLLVEGVGAAVLRGYCSEFSVQERDLGLGVFHAKQSPLGAHVVQGLCVYDGSPGSLRLSQRLLEHFERSVERAYSDVDHGGEGNLRTSLARLVDLARALSQASVQSPVEVSDTVSDSEWIRLIAPGSRAMHLGLDGIHHEVTVVGFKPGLAGALYEVETTQRDGRRFVALNRLTPIHGVSEFIEVNVETGEQRSLH